MYMVILKKKKKATNLVGGTVLINPWRQAVKVHVEKEERERNTMGLALCAHLFLCSYVLGVLPLLLVA